MTYCNPLLWHSFPTTSEKSLILKFLQGVLCVNSLVPTRAPDLPGTAAGPSWEPRLCCHFVIFCDWV